MINKTEINGFVIDNYNQYKLPEGKKEGICPLCSSSRKPINQKKKCASYDWDRGLGTCHNCNNTFQMHTYKRKGTSEKEYTRPVVLEKQECNSKVLKWFETRGISKETI